MKHSRKQQPPPQDTSSNVTTNTQQTYSASEEDRSHKTCNGSFTFILFYFILEKDNKKHRSSRERVGHGADENKHPSYLQQMHLFMLPTSKTDKAARQQDSSLTARKKSVVYLSQLNAQQG